jgi:uncharacterized membrane protein (GlpM family)
VSFFWRLLVANALIVTSVQLGKRSPSLAGLVATMPLTTLIVMIWLHAEDPGDRSRMVDYTRGVLWGILPSIGFFLGALWCFQRRAPLPVVLATSSAVWLVGALFHRWLLR